MDMQTSDETLRATNPEEPRPDFVPKEHYTCPEFNRLEETRLWQRVWQIACREEELPNPGDYVKYDVIDQSIIVVRGDDGVIRAFHNTCQHRGNQILTQERGSVAKFTCTFHGWQWSRDGSNVRVKDAEDWAGCPKMSSDDLRLPEVLVGTWGGFVFINMDTSAEPLKEFLGPVPGFLDCVELEKMRFKRYVTVKLKAKWIAVITSFTESYHVQATHPQLLQHCDEISVGYARDKHGSHGYPNARPFGAPSARTGKPVPDDIREGYVRAMDGFATGRDRNGAVSERSSKAVRRILDELPAGTPIPEVYRRADDFMREAAEAEGAGWPKMTDQQMMDLGVEWNIFPSLAGSISKDAAVLFRARPDSHEVDSCFYDVWLLERVAPDKAPKIEYEYYPEWKPNEEAFPKLVVQDMKNIEQFQRGMNSIGFAGGRINPIQETQVWNVHRMLQEYVLGDA